MRIGITFDLKTASPCDDDSQEEFDSPATIDAIAQAIRRLGHDVVLLGDGRDMLEALLADPPEFVFNFAEGHGVSRTREARVPAVLELLGIPYSGSDPLTLAATLDKDCARRLVASAGIAVPAGFVATGAESVNAQTLAGLRFPVIVKPAWEGSSKGIREDGQAAGNGELRSEGLPSSVVSSPASLACVVDALVRAYRQPVLVEEFIAGDEVTVGLVGNGSPQVIGVMQVVPLGLADPRQFIYSIEVKRDGERRVRYQCPPYAPALLQSITETARQGWEVLGCRDVARLDFRLDGEKVYFLEANPLPGLNPRSSDLVLLARLVGWSHAQLVTAILQAAIDRD